MCSLLCQVSSHGEWSEVVVVGDINCCPTLHRHVKHLHVVKHHQDVGHRAPVDVLQVGVTPLGQDEPVALLLVEDSSKTMGVLSPGHIAVVISDGPEDYLKQFVLISLIDLIKLF